MEIEEQSEPPGKRIFPLPALIPNTPKNKVFYQNGLSKIIPRLTLKVHSEIEKCSELWEMFSPNDSLYQLWSFRKSWYEGYHYKPFFYTLYYGKKVMGTLPLWFNTDEKKYEWFGGYWPEDNVFFVKNQEHIPLLLKVAPKPISINAILPEKISIDEDKIQLVEDEPKYVLKIDDVLNMDDLLTKKISKKHRHHLRHEYGKISQLPLQISWIKEYKPELLSAFRGLSRARFDFQKTDGSAYDDDRRFEVLKKSFENQGEYRLITLSVKVQNHFAVIDVIGIYKDTYYLLTGANDAARFPGIGVYVTFLEFEDALRRNMKTIDVMQIDNSWKHKYFSPKRLLKFEKG